LSGDRLSHIPGWHSANSPHLYDKYTKGVEYLAQVPTIASVYNAYLNIFGGHKIASWDGTYAKNGRSINVKTGEQQPKLHDVSTDNLILDEAASTILPDNATSAAVPSSSATSTSSAPSTAVTTAAAPADSTAAAITSSIALASSQTTVAFSSTTNTASPVPTSSPVTAAQPTKVKKCRLSYY